MAHLLSLTQDERDALLESIVYVDHTKQFGGFKNVRFGGQSLANYSFIYDALKDKHPELLDPTTLRTGDCIQTSDYRGCGTYYAIWLRKGLITHDETFLQQFKAPPKKQLGGKGLKRQLEGDNDAFENEDDDEEERGEIHPKFTKYTKFVKRDANGPHNDGNHDVYLSEHPDEYGYAASTAFSSLDPDWYFTNLVDLEWVKSTFDPLLTHSKSHYGGVIAAAKLTEQFKDDPAFPLGYIGNYDSSVQEEVEWITVEEAKTYYCHKGDYIGTLRSLFDRHFDPSNTDAVLVNVVDSDEV